MRHSTRRRGWGIWLGWACGLAVGIGCVLWANWLVRVNPFARLQEPVKDPTLGLTLRDVDLAYYKAGRLETKAHVASMSIRRDQQALSMDGITSGRYFPKSGDAVRYSAGRAQWDSLTHGLRVSDGARAWSKDYDLHADEFVLDTQKSQVSVENAVWGELMQGHVRAQGMLIDLNTHDFETGPIDWFGKLKLPQPGQADSSQETAWHIKAKSHSTHGNIRTLMDVWMSDGDTIVIADKAVQNIDTDMVTAEGHVRYFSSDADVSCDKVVIDRKQKHATLTGHPTMLIKAEDDTEVKEEEIPPFRPVVPEEIAKDRPPAPITEDGDDKKKLDDDLRSGKTIRKYPALVIADQIDYWYTKGDRHAVITGSPQARQSLPGGRWREIWAYSAFYDGEKDTLKLTSEAEKFEVRLKDSLGDDATGDWVQVSTKRDDDDASGGQIDGNFEVNKSELPEKGTGGSGGGGTTGGSSAGGG